MIDFSTRAIREAHNNRYALYQQFRGEPKSDRQSLSKLPSNKAFKTGLTFDYRGLYP